MHLERAGDHQGLGPHQEEGPVFKHPHIPHMEEFHIVPCLSVASSPQALNLRTFLLT